MIPPELGSLLGFGQVSNMTIAILGKIRKCKHEHIKGSRGAHSQDIYKTFSLLTIPKLSPLFQFWRYSSCQINYLEQNHLTAYKIITERAA